MIRIEDTHLTVFQSSLFQTNAAIIHTDDVMIVADPTWLPHEIEAIKAYVNERLGHRELYVIYTHSDFDHIIGSGVFPKATVIATEELAKNPDKEEAMKQIRSFDQQYYVERLYEPAYPSVDIPITHDGQSVQLGDIKATFYKAPGHTHDGLFTVIETLGIFLSGDYLSDVEFPFIYSSYKDYKDTVRKASQIVKNHDISYHVPGHGTVTAVKQEIEERITFSHYYLEHLLDDNDELEKLCREKFRFYEGMHESHLHNKKMAEMK
ncbi:MBL fold metallo-hydrolase [Paenalkalicoccus suaedae]|uniref:MBL fold metallo-hydrolase n=1 Tax=Paenalkalicoccus suaedae TaxID=2592382 RepID=A0A859FAT8_9BACI|nr:MBL fold metallo-hydrolase [Paenalkalicoccus suaedae]QKS69892.1 MBL fold metallo-hydrolase [Paenalkalicoccus suaedae]